MSRLIIKNGLIVDGYGKKPLLGDILINKNIIEDIGHFDANEEMIIDASGLVVSPGFIDTHSHTDIDLLKSDDFKYKIEQGITTEIVGMCGVSPAPISRDYFSSLQKYLGIKAYNGYLSEYWDSWTEFSKYLSHLSEASLGTNMATFIGHGTLRIAVMGYDNRRATQAELEEMKRLLEDAMINGALGLSTGLIYAPGVYSKEEELIELCNIVKKFEGIHISHMRSESDEVIKSVEEIINIARVTGVKSFISHHKIAGKENWGKSDITLKLIEKAQDQGVEIAIDMYPYKAGMTSLSIVIPPKYHSEGLNGLLENLSCKNVRKKIIKDIKDEDTQWENMIKLCSFDGIMMKSSEHLILNNKTISEYASELGMNPYDTIFEALLISEGKVGAVYFLMSDYDIENIFKFESSMIGTDSGLDPYHPRGVGTFIKVISNFVKNKKLMSLEKAIHKMTYKPAQFFNLDNKGAIDKGKDADIVIFNYSELETSSSYKTPKGSNIGVEYVIIHGKVVLDKGESKGKKYGRLIY